MPTMGRVEQAVPCAEAAPALTPSMLGILACASGRPPCPPPLTSPLVSLPPCKHNDTLLFFNHPSPLPLRSPCRHEDTLSHALRNGEVDDETASDFLCFLTARHCDEMLASAAAAAAEAAEEAAGAAAAEGDVAQEEQAGEQQQQPPEAGTAATATAGSVKREEL